MVACVFDNVCIAVQVSSDHMTSQSNSATDSSVSIAKTAITVTSIEKPAVKFSTGQNEGSNSEKGELYLY